MAESTLDPREELAHIAASLRAYLEWQVDTGATGIPRRPKGAAAPVVAPVVPEPSPVAVAPALADAAEPPRPSPPVGPSIDGPSGRRTLDVIAAEARACTRCALAPTRTNVVFSRGNPTAKLFFIGEAPGADEDTEGVPFVGRAGQLLDKMIVAMGLQPEKDVYVANIIKCRPPGNRRPEPSEMELCIPYLHEQIDNVGPSVIVALGNTAVAGLLGSKLGITKLRGQWKLYRGKIPVMPTYHPSYLLRPSPQQPEAKKQTWEDLQAVMKALGMTRR
jgi:DNA polymerase